MIDTSHPAFRDQIPYSNRIEQAPLVSQTAFVTMYTFSDRQIVLSLTQTPA